METSNPIEITETHPQSTYDLLQEQYARLGMVRTAIVQTTRELAAANELGQDTSPHFKTLGSLFVAERKERDSLAELMSGLTNL